MTRQEKCDHSWTESKALMSTVKKKSLDCFDTLSMQKQLILSLLTWIPDPTPTFEFQLQLESWLTETH